MEKTKAPAMDNKKLMMIAAAIIILVVAFVVVKFVLTNEGSGKEKGGSGEIQNGKEIEEVFQEPPADLKPPALPS